MKHLEKRKGDPTSCAKESKDIRVSLLPIAYKVHKGLLFERLKRSMCYRHIATCGLLALRYTADNYTFDIVQEFIYLGYVLTTKNDNSLEIQRRITLAIRCYYLVSIDN